jgi:hypothetical protein
MIRVSTITKILLLLVAGCAYAQVPVSLSPAPKQTFFDLTGLPCATCTLQSYLAGTTTPTPTYVDATGTSQNPNPIVLDIAGAGNVWLNNTLKYKLVLKDALGSTIWTVDNVSGSGAGGGVVPCSSAFAINYTNSAATALTCDPDITINPSSHAIEIGGTITGPYFSLHNNATITASWTFDVTSPSAALASLGTIPYTQLPMQAADTVLMNATASLATPTAVVLPSGCTNGVNYDSTTHTWSCTASGTVPLSNLATQAADTVVMNASGATASPTAVTMPAGCTVGSNYDTVAHIWTCVTNPIVSRGTFTSPGGTLSANAQTTYDSGVAVTTTQVAPANVYSGSISPILTYIVTVQGGTIKVVISNDSSSTISYGDLVWNYAIL